MPHRLPTHTNGQKIGIYGGSFNPAHTGHVHVALTALKRLNLDAVWVLVSPGNPLKSNIKLPSTKKRASALAQLINHPKVHVLTIEKEFGTFYSIETLKKLHTVAPSIHFTWLMGADNFCELHLWHDWEQFIALTPIAVVDRPDYGLKAVHSPAGTHFARARLAEEQALKLPLANAPAWVLLHAPLHDISSTQLRAKE